MVLVRRSQDLFPTLLNNLFNSDWNERNTQNTRPAMNVIENAEAFKLELTVPGLTKEDLSLEIDEENNLVISMEKKNEKEEKDEHNQYLRKEFSYTQFKQSLSLPENVVKEKISAKVENGLLKIELPKYQPEERKALSQVIQIE